MFEAPDHDAKAVSEALGIPAGGFFCAGEIGPVGGRNFLHGFTATLAVFVWLGVAVLLKHVALPSALGSARATTSEAGAGGSAKTQILRMAIRGGE